MGGCATKPKGFNPEDTNEAPAPVPALEPTKEEKAGGDAPESKDKEVLLVSESENKVGEADYFETDKKGHKVEGVDFDQIIKEVADVNDKGTDEHTKRRSLSNLFKENEQGNEEKAPEPVKASEENEKTTSEMVKDSTENEKGPSEPVKAEVEIVKPTQVEPTPAVQEFVATLKEPFPAETQQSEAKSTEEVNEDSGENAKPGSEGKALESMKENSVLNVKPDIPVSEGKTSELNENFVENVEPVSEVKTIELKEKTSENDKVVVLSEEKAMELKESGEVKDKM